MKPKMGDSRKYQYPTTDGFHVLIPLAFGNSRMRYSPLPSEFHNRESPYPPEFPLFWKYIFNLALPLGCTRLYPYLDIGLTGVCRWDVIGIVPIAMRSLALWAIEGIDVLRVNVTGILGPGRKKVLLYISEEASLATNSSLFSLHFPTAKTLWVLTSPSLLLSVVMLLWGLLCVICLWVWRGWTPLHLVSLAKQ